MLPTHELFEKLPDVEQDVRQVEELPSPIERALVALVIPVLDTPTACAVAKRTAKAMRRPMNRAKLDAFLGDLPRRLTRSPVLATVRRFLGWWADSEPPAEELLASRISPEELAARSGLKAPVCARVVLFTGSGPLLPLDPPIARVCIRHGWLDWPMSEPQPWIPLEGLDRKVCLHLYFGMRSISRSHCKARSPLCDTCTLRPLLPETGPCEPEVAM